MLLASFGRNYKTRADDLTDLLMKIMGSRDTEKELSSDACIRSGLLLRDSIVQKVLYNQGKFLSR